MCGIFGQWSEQGIRRDVLNDITAVLRHRGPDDTGFYLAPKVVLGSLRLSIIDLDTGKQPIANEDGTIWIVFNGEIYNYPELRRRLVERGHCFKTNSDTEVIVHLYEEQGPACVKELRGMFAFAIWDENSQRLFLARDHVGQKPLYYSHSKGQFSFASEIKALLVDKSVTPRLNQEAMHHYLSLRYVPETATFFAGVAKLPAGHTLTLVQGRVEVQAYWNLHYQPKQTSTRSDVVAQLRHLLLETVKCHMLSDVPLGAFLSGGIDSSLITAMMCTLSDAPIKTFSVGVKAPDFDELPYARMVAQKYGTEHHELMVEPDMISALPEMLWHMEEPVDPFAFGVYSVARLASRHVKVVLGGDGGDELFAGYDRYLGNQLVDLYCLLPPALRRHIVEPLVRQMSDNYSYNNRVQKLRWLIAMSSNSAGERYAQSAAFLRFGHAHKKALYTEQLWQELGGLDSAEQLLCFYNAQNAADPLDKMLYTDLKTRLADHLLMITDRMTMAHSLEGRSPYADHLLAEFVATIPAQYKLNGRSLKFVQRQVAREFLPTAIVRRAKQGFSFPLAYWFKNELFPLATNLFRDSRLVAEGLFRQEAMLQLLNEHARGGADHNYRLWLLLNLELWHRLFVDGVSQSELRASLVELADPGGRLNGPVRSRRELQPSA